MHARVIGVLIGTLGLLFTATHHVHAQGIPIGALPAATSVSSSDLLIVSQSAVTKKATVSLFGAAVSPIATGTLVGNNTGATALPIAVTVAQVKTMLGLGTAAYATLGTSGNTVPVLSAANTWSALQTLTAGIALSGGITITGGLTADTLTSTGTTTVGTGLTVSLGGAAITGNTSVASGTFTASGGAFTASPANANDVLSPTGTGVVTINPATAGTMNNMSVGQTVPLAVTSTTLKTTGTTLTFQSAGTTGTLTWAPASSGKTITLPNGTTDFTATGATNAFLKQNSAGAAITVATIACADLSNAGTACTAATGTSGATLPFLNGTNTWSGTQTFGSGVLVATSPSFTTPVLGVATGTSLALGGCTIGANALCTTGAANISTTLTAGTSLVAPLISTASTALTITPNNGQISFSYGGTPAFQLTNTTLGSDLKTFAIENTTNLRIVANNDALNANTLAYQINRGTTYNVASHHFYTSTAAGTSVEGFEVLNTGGANHITVQSATNPVMAASAGTLTLTAPAIGVATGTSLAIGGCTIGTDVLCTTGPATFTNAAATTLTALASSASAIHEGVFRNGSTGRGSIFIDSSSTGGNITGQVAFGQAATQKGAVWSDGSGNFAVEGLSSVRLFMGIYSASNGDYVRFTPGSAGGTIDTNAGTITIGSAGGTTTLSDTNLTVTAAAPIITNLATDATHTDRSVCQDSTSKALYFGSGVAGICLGTSSERYKEKIEPLGVGLPEIMKLSPSQFYYKPGYGDEGAKQQFGFIAEDVTGALPRLVGLDEKARPNTVDMVGMIPVTVKAIQELKADNDNLQSQIDDLKKIVAGMKP